MDRKEILLIVVSKAGTTPLTPVQLQKAVFLIAKARLPELPTPFYDFEPYNYGPFCKAIYTDADDMQVKGLVYRIPSGKGHWVDTVITSTGQICAQKLKNNLLQPNLTFIGNVVNWVQSQPFTTLVSKIYELFPEYRQNSVFHEV